MLRGWLSGKKAALTADLSSQPPKRPLESPGLEEALRGILFPAESKVYLTVNSGRSNIQ